MSLWKTLLHPDREELEDAERREVGRAANFLQVGEFQILQLAYRAWHEEDLPGSLEDRLFHDYMIHNEVPHWARHYARQILRLENSGRLDMHSSQYHVYDKNYGAPVQNGVRRFWVATISLAIMLGTAIVVAENSGVESSSLFPPYFSDEELRQTAQQPGPAEEDGAVFDGFGRADDLQPRTGP